MRLARKSMKRRQRRTTPTPVPHRPHPLLPNRRHLRTGQDFHRARMISPETATQTATKTPFLNTAQTGQITRTRPARILSRTIPSQTIETTAAGIMPKAPR